MQCMLFGANKATLGKRMWQCHGEAYQKFRRRFLVVAVLQNRKRTILHPHTQVRYVQIEIGTQC